MRAILCSILLVAAATGCKSKPAPTTPPDDTADTVEHNEEEHSADEHEALTPELTAFHDYFAPIWHSEAPDRAATACDATANMLMLADKVEDAGMPEGAAADWSQRVSTLMLAIDHMKEGCQNGSADFDANFTAVHEGFHALMEALPKG
jgi:hypothetical protein